MSHKSLRLILPLISTAIAVAGITASYAAQGANGRALEKKRVAARGQLKGSGEVLAIVIWQTHNLSSSSPHHATAHLAIETTGRDRRTIWQADGANTWYKIDSVKVADLDADGLPEIISLWRESPNAGALRVFHWDQARRSFVEASSRDDLKRVRSYRITDISKPKNNRRLIAYSSLPSISTREYELLGSKLLPSGERTSEARMQETKQEQSGIEGVAVIKISHPVTRENDPDTEPRPFQASLVIVTKNEDREVARLQTGPDGRFRVSLPPGEYIIRPLRTSRIGSPRASEHLARVSAGRFIYVRIVFDSVLQ